MSCPSSGAAWNERPWGRDALLPPLPSQGEVGRILDLSKPNFLLVKRRS